MDHQAYLMAAQQRFQKRREVPTIPPQPKLPALSSNRPPMGWARAQVAPSLSPVAYTRGPPILDARSLKSHESAGSSNSSRTPMQVEQDRIFESLRKSNIKEDSDENFKGFDSWTDVLENSVTISLPVHQVIQFKSIEEDSEGQTFLVATMIQTIIGVSPRDSEGNPRYFHYRFNNMEVGEENLQLRRSEEGRTTFEDGSDGVLYSKHIFSVRVALNREAIFNHFPFMIFSLNVKMELASFEHNNRTFKPKLAFYPNVLNEGELWRQFVVRDPSPEEFDGCHSIDFISPHPSIEVEGSALRIKFFVNNPFHKNFVTNVVPVVIIIVQNIINVWIKQEAADFLGNSSGIALNLVFLLPMMYPSVNAPSNGFGFNDFGAFMILISMLLGMIKFFWSNIGISFNENSPIPSGLEWTECATSEIYCVAWGQILPTIVTGFGFMYFLLLWSSQFSYMKCRNAIVIANGGVEGVKNINIDEKKYNLLKSVQQPYNRVRGSRNERPPPITTNTAVSISPSFSIIAKGKKKKLGDKTKENYHNCLKLDSNKLRFGYMTNQTTVKAAALQDNAPRPSLLGIFRR